MDTTPVKLAKASMSEMTAVLGVFAESERSMIVARVRAGSPIAFPQTLRSPWEPSRGLFFLSCLTLEGQGRSSSKQAAQQCRRHKGLMRNTAASCFPSTRVGGRLLCWGLDLF